MSSKALAHGADSCMSGNSFAAHNKSSSSSFCIDALLAREDPVRCSPSPSSSERGSPAASLRISPGAQSPFARSSSSHSSHTPQSHERAAPSPLWTNRISTAMPPTSHGHTVHPSSTSSGLFPSAVATHSLYAAMYGGGGHLHGPHPSAGVSPSSMSLIHGSAFHSPLHDMKGHHGSGSLSMDWLARAGLLYHRSPGKQTSLLIF